MDRDSKWDRQTDDGIVRSQPRTIIVSQPAKKSQLTLANDEPLTDEYLNHVLPTVGFRIVSPPPGYVPLKREPRPSADTRSLPRVPKEFESLFTDLRPDGELTSSERQTRQVMRLLLQVKEGTPHERKLGLRILVTHAREIGPDVIFTKLIPLLSSGILTGQERHSLLKATDRLMFRLSSQMSAYIPSLLSFAGQMLCDDDMTARNEAREMISSLAKLGGLPLILHTVRPGLETDDGQLREVTARTLATAAISLGIPTILPFLRAAINSRKSPRIRQTGLRVVNAIAFQSGNGVLPFLREMLSLLALAMSDDSEDVVASAIRCVATLADAAAPFGGDAFGDIVAVVWDGVGRRSTHQLCLKAIVFIVRTMERAVAATHFRRLLDVVIGQGFGSLKVGQVRLRLSVFQHVLDTDVLNPVSDARLIGRIRDIFFHSVWNQRMAQEAKLRGRMIGVCVGISRKSSAAKVVKLLFSDFKVRNSDFRELAIICFSKICEDGTNELSDHRLVRVMDNLLYALDDVSVDKKSRFIVGTIRNFVHKIGDRVSIFVQQVPGQIAEQLKDSRGFIRQHAADLLNIFVVPLISCRCQDKLLYFYGIIQEFLGEEYPNVLASVLDVFSTIFEHFPVADLKPSPEEVAMKLVPIFKNRHNRVAYSCIALVMTLTQKMPEVIQKKEWMRICFELLELLKADKAKVRIIATRAFAYIARAIGPFDVLLALLANLQVQERQIRICTTSAIAILAENCGTFNVLPALMNEYRTPDLNVQNGTLKAFQFLFQTIGAECADYAYSVTPLLTHALIERDAIHRQIACLVVKYFALGCFAAGKEDAMIHLLNHLLPNIFESTLHFIDAVFEALDALRVALGPGVLLQYILAGLFHPARKVRSQFWRVYNNLVIYDGDRLVPYYPLMQKRETCNYHRDEFDVFV
jgi:splicing factor 3B subunit 1